MIEHKAGTATAFVDELRRLALVEHVADHRRSGHMVQHLRPRRFHAGSLARSEHNDVDVGHDVHNYRSIVRRISRQENQRPDLGFTGRFRSAKRGAASSVA